ncbi:MAG TPA: O-antigen ligase family protein [Polyangia bacterium]|nr:O-antigen ligase family protein [Polyangia bacterium]
MFLKIVLFVQLLFVVNQIHFPWAKSGIPGVAAANVIFLVALLAMRGKTEEVTAPAMLKKPMMYFFGALAFSFLWAQVRGGGDFLDDLTYFKNAVFFMLFYFIHLRCRQDEKTTRLLIIWILVIAAVAGLEAVHEGFDYGFGKYNPFRRASGPFGEDWHNSNRAGVFYAMFMPMFVAMALFLRQRKLWRIAAIGGIILLAGGTLFTYSRQSYFIVIFAFALLFLRKSVILTALVTIVLISSVSYLPDSVFQRVEETKQVDKNGQEETDESTASRWEIWAQGLAMAADAKIGVGLNRFKKELGNYGSHKKMDAHDFYVLTLAEMGPQGLATLIFLLFTCMKLTAFVRKNLPADDPETRALALGFTVMTVCMMMGEIYGSPFFDGEVMAPYWSMCGLMERYTHLKMQATVPVAAAQAEPSMTERFPLAAYMLSGRPDRPREPPSS